MDEDLDSVFFLTPKSGWAVGGYGSIVHTEDGGRTWQTQYEGNSLRQHLSSIFFTTSQSGWAVGWGGTILHTDNGGHTWRHQTSDTQESLNSVYFLTPQSGCTVGVSGTILRTDDGGRSWQTQTKRSDDDLDSVFFVTPQSGWAMNGFTILHTEDGGHNWLKQAEGFPSVLNSVYFVTAQSGWAVGFDGEIVHTDDGGRTWQAQTSDIHESLSSVFFVTPQSGWAVGDSGTILHTQDGGHSWRKQASGFAEQLNSVYFVTSQSGWAVGKSGTILHTEDGGYTWLGHARTDLRSIFFATSQSGWTVGTHGTILHTEDGGSTWLKQSSGSDVDLISVFFATPQSGWGVENSGAILHTEDGGHTWLRQLSKIEPLNLQSIFFVTPQSGWAVGLSGILHTEDGGRTWQRQGDQDGLISVFFVTPQSGWAVGLSGILHTKDGGRTWQRQYTQHAFNSVSFVTPQSGWAADFDGTILHTDDGGQNWKMQGKPSTDLLTSVFFVTSESGWIARRSGTILHTDDGGQNWTTQHGDNSFHEPLFSAFFLTPRSGWVAGWNGTILHTEDGGRSWVRQGYRRWPAPWFVLVTLFLGLTLTLASRPVLPKPVDSIEETEDSDSPVETVEQDSLGYAPLVERLRRFVQNPKTKPPLVLAVQAPWGMGKSSVMRMLQSELKRNRVAATAWFNAWHHQKEDHLLAYLLEEIQKEVAPSWFTPVGLGFRFNLLRVRMFSSPDRFLGTVGSLAVLAFHAQLAALLSVFTPRLADNVVRPALWLLPALFLLAQTRAFYSQPSKLLEESTTSAWRFLQDLVFFRSLKGKTDVRPEFRRDLKEVTEALLPQRLVIFLDDLDRCRPELVVETLEAINFLSSAAPCFIVLGADYRKVETLAAMRFETIAMQEAENAAARGSDGPVNSVIARVEHAKSYMRKIINMRLNLPFLSSPSFEKFLTQRRAPERRSFRGLQRAVLVAAVTAASILIALQPVWFQRENPSHPAAAQFGEIGIQPPSPETSVISGTGAAGAAETSHAPKAPKISQPSGYEGPDPNEVGLAGSKRLVLVVTALGLLFAIVRVLRQPKNIPEARDSEAFMKALRDLAPEIQRRADTPREMRRFMNYLRFIAGSPDDRQPKGTDCFEPQLVKLAATGIQAQEGKISSEIVEYYRTQCDLIGVDPETFRPKEES